MPRLGILSSLLLLAHCHAEDHAKALVEWIRSKPGGFVSEKMEIRRMFPNDPNSPMGVYATQDIAPLEPILQVPRDFYLGLDEEEIENEDLYEDETATTEEIMSVFYTNNCRLALKILKEMAVFDRNPQESNYAPFLAYLKTQQKGQLPATYSPTAKALLRKLSGPPKQQDTTTFNKTSHYRGYSLPPWQLVDWIDSHFVATGCIAPGDEEAYHAAALSIQRGYDSELIPVWDMFNHHNGKLNLDTNSLHSDEGLKVWASKNIKAGDELFATYNYCRDCYEGGDDWGTPGVFRDFGFVEDYPQMWPFLDHKIEYEIKLHPETGELYAVFDRDEQTGEIVYGLPDADGLAYLKTELARVSDFDIQEELVKLGNPELPPHELDSITRYHQTVLVALKIGIDAALKEIDEEEELCGMSNELEDVELEDVSVLVEIS
jgi:SET domain